MAKVAPLLEGRAGLKLHQADLPRVIAICFEPYAGAAFIPGHCVERNFEFAHFSLPEAGTTIL
jgi:hypothetical protein